MPGKLFSLFFLCSVLFTHAQTPSKPNSTEIYEAIKKLNFLGSVLYVAAHPDDENTQMISYFSNHVKARTGYLSITRGDGGQNLIGPELKELLGLIRTQELLAARGIDGGEQLFTRAIDFGYSKHPEETLTIWNKEEVLKDIVLIIRRFKPDIIINRFDHRTPGTTHGQHTSSAMLSVEAFDLAGDLKFIGHNSAKAWQPQRLFFNTSWWFYGSEEKFEKADKSKMLSLDTGVYYPTLGLSNNEVAALSRSQHKSQGFGSTGSRGSRLEYVELIKGDLPRDKQNIFNGINTSWTRVKGGKEIGELLYQVEKNYDFEKPEASLPKLLKAYTLIRALEDEHWKKIKLQEIKAIITACSGLYLEAVASVPITTKGTNVKLNIEAINRSHTDILLKNIKLQPGQETRTKNIPLKINSSNRFTEDYIIQGSAANTSPYWLDKVWGQGMYIVENKDQIGRPETDRQAKVSFDLSINEVAITLEKDIVYKYNDPVRGEVYEPFEIVPQVNASIRDKVILFSDRKAKIIPVLIEGFTNNITGTVSLCYPEGWKVTPEKVGFSLTSKGDKEVVEFEVTPPEGQSEGMLSPVVSVKGEDYTGEIVQLDYDHIPKQTVTLPSKAKVVRLNLKTIGTRIGYIQGAGDNIPSSLRQIGYDVMELDENAVSLDHLKQFDAVILGIRIYNVSDRAGNFQKELHKYVEQGGTLIVQYNTSRGLKVDAVAPFKLILSRDRVVDENSEVILLDEKHPLLSYPNRITNKDFGGWIQERGLYFPAEWSEEFTPVLSMRDKGESPKEGSLIVAKYGKGNFIYTGLSFFRELPAGVPGAYKLFANMIAIGKQQNK